MAMQGTDIALHCGFVPPTMDLRFLSTGSGLSRIPRRTKSELPTDGESEVEAEAEEADLPPEEPWCPPIPRRT